MVCLFLKTGFYMKGDLMKKINLKKDVIDFAAKTKSLDKNEKLKLILFASGVKPATFIMLKVFPEKPEEAVLFDRLLKEAGIVFRKSFPKTFEEISLIKDNEIRWDIKGVWLGYDLFNSKSQLNKFRRYLSLADKGKHSQADRLAGEIYGYPKSCVDSFIKRNKNHKLIAEKFSYYEYYKFLHDIDKKFPFIQHQPHSLDCRSSISMNKRYQEIVKKVAPDFYKEFSKKKVFDSDVVVDVVNDVMIHDFLTKKSRSIWPVKDGQDYMLITLKQIDGKFWLISHLTKNFIERGTVFPAKITMQYDYAEIKLGKFKNQKGELYHERMFPLQGKGF